MAVGPCPLAEKLFKGIFLKAAHNIFDIISSPEPNQTKLKLAGKQFMYFFFYRSK